MDKNIILTEGYITWSNLSGYWCGDGHLNDKINNALNLRHNNIIGKRIKLILEIQEEDKELWGEKNGNQ